MVQVKGLLLELMMLPLDIVCIRPYYLILIVTHIIDIPGL